jgi:hypothetical protein
MRNTRRWILLLGAMVALGFGDVVRADPNEVELEVAQMFLEFNSTDDDLGVQVFLDADGWKKMQIFDPDGDEIATFKAQGRLENVGGLTELRFESAEPSPDEVLGEFPEGDYEFKGKTVDGGNLVGVATLSHDLPDAPVYSPSDGEEVEIDDAVVEWEEDEGVVAWEVIVENEDLGVELSVRLAADVTELKIPPSFLRPETEYDLEVLAIAANGNKTIAESTFVTAAEDGDGDEDGDDD